MRPSLVMFWVAVVALVSCVRLPPDHLDVVVTHDGKPVRGVEIRTGERLLGRSDAEGRLRLDDLRPFGTNLLLEARHPDPLSTLLPQVRNVEIPWEYFPEDLRVELELVPIPQSSEVANAAQQGATGGGDVAPNAERVESNPLASADSPRALVESDLAPEPTRTPLPTPTAAPTFVATPTLSENENRGSSAAPLMLSTPPATGASPAIEAPREIVAHLFLSGKPLSGVQVFATDQGTHSLVQMGVTGGDGVLRAPFPAGLKPEGLLMRHPCCKPQLRPIMAQGQSPNMTTLSAEKGRDFVLLRDLYGYARTVPNTELWSGGARLDVAGETGIAIAALSQVVKNEFSLVNRDAVPEIFLGKLPLKESEPKPVIVYTGTKRAQLPVVGLIEFAAGEEGAGGSNEGRWRRFRREFFSRFVQNQTIRAMIPSDVLTLGDAAKLKPRELVERGWEFTVMSPSLDFLLVLDGQQRQSFVARLVDRSGTVLWEAKVATDDAVAPEKRGAELFGEFLGRFPYEGTVLALAEGVVTVNLSNDIDRALKTGQAFQFFGPQKGEAGARLVEPVGRGEVIEIGRGTIRVRLSDPKLELKAERWIGVRARRGKLGEG